jgi:HNH endonuclease
MVECACGCGSVVLPRSRNRQSRFIRGHSFGRPPLTEAAIIQRFWARVVRGEGCWGWTGWLRKADQRPIYRARYAYVWSYELTIGPVPPGYICHHVCENSQCVNPYHIQLMTQGEHLKLHGNTGDHYQAHKLRCPQGHPYDDANTYVYHRKDGGVERHCRLCRSDAKRRWNESRRG